MQKPLVNSVAVVGGGTAGMVAALMLKKIYPALAITVIESPEQPIIGVGEGSTEHWHSFMQLMGITAQELIAQTGATLKHGVKFQNWLGHGEHFFHSVSEAFFLELPQGGKWTYSYQLARGAGPKDLVHDYLEQNLVREPYTDCNQFHFDNHRLNQYLHSLAQQLGIPLIQAHVRDCVITDQGIQSLITDQGTLDYDFYLDCTGQQRLLICETLGVAWQSYAQYLPLDRALVWSQAADPQIPTHTLSRAQDQGWRFEIPTQGRVGMGYIFSSAHSSEDQIRAELAQDPRLRAEQARVIKFQPGQVSQAWHQNCVAMGLAQSFVEPLEASSIGSTVQQTWLLAQLLPQYAQGDRSARIDYCDRVNQFMSNVLSFVSLHYQTPRSDTAFWQACHRLPLCPELVQRLSEFRERMPDRGDFPDRWQMFKEANWLQIMVGLGLLPPEAVQRDLDLTPQWLQQMISDRVQAIDHSRSRDQYWEHAAVIARASAAECR